MKWNLNATFGIALTTLLLTLCTATDANAQSGWDFYSAYFSQPQSSAQQTAPSHWSGSQIDSRQAGNLNQANSNQAYQQLNTNHYAGEADFFGLPGNGIQTHPGINTMHAVEVYGHAQNPQTNLHYQNLAPAVICQSNT